MNRIVLLLVLMLSLLPNADAKQAQLEPNVVASITELTIDSGGHRMQPLG